jgi:hypothetical protein
LYYACCLSSMQFGCYHTQNHHVASTSVIHTRRLIKLGATSCIPSIRHCFFTIIEVKSCCICFSLVPTLIVFPFEEWCLLGCYAVWLL